MFAAVHRLLLHAFGRLPVAIRRRIVRTIAPSFTVGAMCVIRRSDGAILLVRHSYRERWGVPGGLLRRGEDVGVGARREVAEEVGLAVALIGEPAVVVDANPQRVDVVFEAEPVPGADVDAVAARSAEIVEVRWFLPDELPELQFETSGAMVALARRRAGAAQTAIGRPRVPGEQG